MATKKHKDTITDISDHNIFLEKREIFLSNNHKEDDDINTTLAAQFVKNLRLLDSINNDPITVHLLAGLGGDIDAGFVIFDYLSSSKSKITLVVHGNACSMSSVIVQSADIRLMMPNSYMMIHCTKVGVDYVNTLAASSLIEKLKEDEDKILNIYVDRCKNGKYFDGWKLSKIKTFIKNKLKSKEDWYVNCKDCVDFGLADGIYEMI